MRKNILNALLLTFTVIVGYAVASRFIEDTRDFR